MLTNLNDVDNILFARRNKAKQDAKLRKEALFSSNPDVLALDDRIRSLRVDRIRLMRQGGNCDSVDAMLAQAHREFDTALLKLNLPLNYLEPWYKCSKCNDTGYIGTKRCTCADQLIYDAMYHEASIDKATEQNFDKFDLSIFDGDDSISKKQFSDMKRILAFSIAYADRFCKGDSQNLIFIGQTGTGKTFLSNCIAGRVLKNGHSVLAVSAAYLIEELRSAAINGINNLRKYIDVELLVVDELGMEQMFNNITIEMLFMVINERCRKGLPIIISTNLLPEQMTQRYTERITSRLFDKEKSTVLLFEGHDVRLKNRK